MLQNSVTIRDVAKHANVSPATVSRVLSDNGYPVRKDVKTRVLESAQILHYIPAPLKRRQEKESPKDVALIIPNISNPFYQQASLGAQIELEKNGYSVLLCNTFRRKDKEIEYLHTLFSNNVCGVILSSSADQPDMLSEYLSDYILSGMRIVLLDQLAIKGELCTHINFDNASGAALAVQHFIENGHRKIAFCSTPITRWSRKNMFQGFKDALLQNKIPLIDDYLLIDSEEENEMTETGYEFQAGIKMADEYVRRGLDATALLAVNDMMAIGVIKGLQKYGINVPKDVSVIGHDNIPFSGMVTPELTTIHCPSHDIGRLAAQQLIDQMINDGLPHLNIKLQPKLIQRDSVQDLTKHAGKPLLQEMTL